MNIIGRKNSTSLIVEIEEKELRMMIGYYFKRRKETCPKFEVGDEIHISKVYTQLDGLIKNKSRIDDAEMLLNGVLESLSSVNLLTKDLTTDGE